MSSETTARFRRSPSNGAGKGQNGAVAGSGAAANFLQCSECGIEKCKAVAATAIFGGIPRTQHRATTLVESGARSKAVVAIASVLQD